jgi:putative phosphoesterase
MRVLILSDIHGNLPSLEYILNFENSTDLVVSLGDVVNYGPWSNECVELLETYHNKILIRGNHEDAFIMGNYTGINPVTKAFFNHCYPDFDKKDIIKEYIDEFILHDTKFIHTLNDTYVFPDTEIELSRNTFVGHSHRSFTKMCGDFRLVNPGSVGQNRTNINILNYAIWDTDEDEIELINKFYPADNLINEMLVREYPEICVNYIKSKSLL